MPKTDRFDGIAKNGTFKMTETLDSIIIDDEPLVRDDLRFLLNEHPEIRICGEAGTVKEAKTLLSQMIPAVVFAVERTPTGNSSYHSEEISEPPVIRVGCSGKGVIRSKNS